MFCGPLPSHWKWQKKAITIFFLTSLRKKRLRQKRCARGKLVGVEEEIFWKSYKFKVWSISKSQFYHLQRRTSDVKSRPSKCWVPYFLIIGGAIVEIFVLQKKKFNSNKFFSKKTFFAKKTFYWTWIWKMLWRKKMHKGQISGRKKNFNKKKSKLKVWHSFKKNTLNHTSGTQKKVFFQFRILRSVSVW